MQAAVVVNLTVLDDLLSAHPDIVPLGLRECFDP